MKHDFILSTIVTFLGLASLVVLASGYQRVSYGGGEETFLLDGQEEVIQYSTITNRWRNFGYPTFARKELASLMSDLYEGKPEENKLVVEWALLALNVAWILGVSLVVGWGIRKFRKRGTGQAAEQKV